MTLHELRPSRVREDIACPRDAWYVLASSDELGAEPRSRALFGTPIVLYRARGGRPVAQLDRCPHRHVPLSMGKASAGGIECAYHGWRFDEAGRCTAVPGLCGPIPPLARVDTFATREQDGFVWVFGEPFVDPEVAPPRFPFASDERYSTIRHSCTIAAPLIEVAENTLDVPHTAFLHAGLLRGSGEKRRIEVDVRELEDRVEAEYHGEPRPRGLIGRLLAPAGGEVVHIDRFVLPSLLEVEYRLGDTSHVFNTAALTPIDAKRTLFSAVVSIRLPIPTGLVARAAKGVLLRILAQDAEMLGAQARAMSAGADRPFVSTELDVLRAAVERLLRRSRGADAAAAPHQASRRVAIEIG